MTAYAEYHGQVLREVTGIHIDGKTYRAAAIKADHEGLRAIAAAVLHLHGVDGLNEVLKLALSPPAEPAPGTLQQIGYIMPEHVEQLARGVDCPPIHLNAAHGFTVPVYVTGDDMCPVCSGDCAGANPPVMNCPMQRIEELKRAVAPLVDIANAYDENELDDEARNVWGPAPDYNAFTNNTPPAQIELYSGRGGKRLLTLADCLKAREVARS